MLKKEGIKHKVLAKKIEEAWEVSWKMFFRKETCLFYDYLTSYEPSQYQADLPRPDEITAQNPNPCGWGTGMEDSMISAGAMIVMICDRYDVTGNEGLRQTAAEIFKGMVACAEVYGVKGFIARSICLFDGKSIYTDSSRDQYTHYVHGLWHYYHSRLSNEESRKKIREIMNDICIYVEKCVVPENNYIINRADGVPGSTTVCKMWDVAPHEAARLPMIYAAGWDITGNPHWHELYRQYARKAAEQSAGLKCRRYWSYALLQMQCSLELLYYVEKDDNKLRALYHEAMDKAAEIAEFNGWQAHFAKHDLTVLPGNWRERTEKQDVCGYIIPVPAKAWIEAARQVREGGEAPLIQMMSPQRRMSEFQVELLKQAIVKPDYTKIASYGIFYLQAAYWKAVKLGFLSR